MEGSAWTVDEDRSARLMEKQGREVGAAATDGRCQANARSSAPCRVLGVQGVAMRGQPRAKERSAAARRRDCSRCDGAG